MYIYPHSRSPHSPQVDIALERVGVDFEWQPGCIASGSPDAGAELIPSAVELAKRSDLSLLILGDIEETCGEWGDRECG